MEQLPVADSRYLNTDPQKGEWDATLWAITKAAAANT